MTNCRRSAGAIEPRPDFPIRIVLKVSAAALQAEGHVDASAVAGVGRAAAEMAATLHLCCCPVMVREAMLDDWRERATSIANLVVSGLCVDGHVDGRSTQSDDGSAGASAAAS